MSAPKVVGLDLSMTATGICRANGTTRTVATRQQDGDKRLCVIRTAVLEDAFGADLVVLEDAPPGLKGPAIKAIHMVHGAVRSLLVDMGVPYAAVNPSTLKLYATGSKSADKIAMALSAFKRAEKEFADDNACDAWWLRSAGLTALGHTAFSLPIAQVRALSVVAWPQGMAIPELAA